MAVLSAGKIMASTFWDSQGIIMIDYLEQGRTIYGTYYADVCDKKSGEKGGANCLKAIFSCTTIDAPAHTSQVQMAEATDCGFEILPYSPYFPDFAPSDFYLFPKLKTKLRGRHFGS
jgi:hypothetical protein